MPCQCYPYHQEGRREDNLTIMIEQEEINMDFLYHMLRALDSIISARQAHAHCDIPCGIYDPHTAQMAAHTVIRMAALIEDLRKEHGKEHDHDHGKMQEHVHKLARYTLVKEEHAELCKKEIRILWGDYFKPEHLQEYPQLHELVFRVMKLGSKARQEVNPEASKELLEAVQEIAEIFWKTKGIRTERVAAPYPSGGTLVVPKLH